MANSPLDYNKEGSIDPTTLQYVNALLTEVFMNMHKHFDKNQFPQDCQLECQDNFKRVLETVGDIEAVDDLKVLKEKFDLLSLIDRRCYLMVNSAQTTTKIQDREFISALENFSKSVKDQLENVQSKIENFYY